MPACCSPVSWLVVAHTGVTFDEAVSVDPAFQKPGRKERNHSLSQ